MLNITVTVTHLPVGLGAKRILGGTSITFFPFWGNLTMSSSPLTAAVVAVSISPSTAPTPKEKLLTVSGLMVKELTMRTCRVKTARLSAMEATWRRIQKTIRKMLLGQEI